jgi:formylglycine-generating enzyme required for sulfatase activity
MSCPPQNIEFTIDINAPPLKYRSIKKEIALPTKEEIAKIANINRVKIEPELVLIKGDTFQIGRNCSYVQPIIIKDFLLGKFEVSVSQFKTFVDDTNYKTDAEKKASSETLICNNKNNLVLNQTANIN